MINSRDMASEDFLRKEMIHYGEAIIAKSSYYLLLYACLSPIVKVDSEHESSIA